MAQNELEKFQIILQELVRRTNDFNSRVRGIEQRVQSLEDRTNMIEESSIDRTKKMNDKFLEIEARFRNMNDDLMLMKNNLEKINRQISKFAMKKDVKEVEKMFEILSPIRNEFVTEEEFHEHVDHVKEEA